MDLKFKYIEEKGRRTQDKRRKRWEKRGIIWIKYVLCWKLFLLLVRMLETKNNFWRGFDDRFWIVGYDLGKIRDVWNLGCVWLGFE